MAVNCYFCQGAFNKIAGVSQSVICHCLKRTNKKLLGGKKNQKHECTLELFKLTLLDLGNMFLAFFFLRKRNSLVLT